MTSDLAERLPRSFSFGPFVLIPEHQLLLRGEAAVRIADGAEPEAETLLLDAMALAQETGALSWRLRAATDLAGLWSATARQEDALRLLSPICSEFTEGLETPDLLAAEELLASLTT